jgi:hypothetical protein
MMCPRSGTPNTASAKPPSGTPPSRCWSLRPDGALLRDDPFDGVGKPEPLKHALAGGWSRRIDEANRLVYLVDDNYVIILQARDHY